MNDFSLVQLEDLILESSEPWEKKTIYASDSEKCPRGVYYALKGAEPTNPIDPRGKRRMEVGNMIEYNLVKKLKALGIMVEAQARIFDEEYNVSGRHDGLIINPNYCTQEALKHIERKKELFKLLEEQDQRKWTALSEYHKGDIEEAALVETLKDVVDQSQPFYREDDEINKELLVPNEENGLILLEIKSIVDAGFRWRKSDGAPMSGHLKQIMFYYWKYREKFPNLKASVLYSSTDYQDLLEFQVDYNEEIIDNLKRFWTMINKAVETNTPPHLPPEVIQNPRTGKWQVNVEALWCSHHEHCTGNPNWKEEAYQKVKELNA